VRGLAQILDGDEKDGDVLLTALAALEAFGSAAGPAVPALAKTLPRHDVRTRLWTIQALRAVGAEAQKAAPALIAVLANPKSDVAVRRSAAQILAKFSGNSDVAAALGKALDDPDSIVREEASAALLDRK
jgi:HEAT repeat protein